MGIFQLKLPLFPGFTVFYFNNFNIEFREHREDFIYVEGNSRFFDLFIKEGHKIKPIEETMTIMHLENNYGNINVLEQMEVLKAASSQNILHS